MNMRIPDEVLRLMKKLNEHGHECYVIGGAVRDALLQRPVHDYDLTTDALPEEMLAIFRPEYTVLPTGIKHGTVTVISNKMPVEITTYRADGDYTDHRHPDAVTFTRSLREDCARRDFTINAMGCSATLEICDFFGGQEDLKNGIIRCIGVPQDRLDEDALRILRAIRFAARFGFTIEAATSAALFEKKDLLACVSRERIRSELIGLLSAPHVSYYLLTYRDIFAGFLPIEETLAKACDMCDPDPLVRLAILLSNTPSAEKLLRALKCSTNEIHTVLTMITHKDMPADSRIDVRHILNQITCAPSQYIAFRCALDPAVNKEALTAIADTILKNHDCISLKALAVNGNDLKEAGISGKDIGLSLHKALQAVINDELPNTKKAILEWLSNSH